ncbi:MAG: hypothetical protein QNL04_00830 [SAR324 cluster bacterium]|nr:hypothetical protein [SAR324 cluster bacterium]
MENQILVFRLENFDFALNSEDFNKRLNLDRVEIAPSTLDPALWHYKASLNGAEKGLLLHLGAVIGLTPMSFSEKGSIFIKEIGSKTGIGLYLENYLFSISGKYLEKKRRPTGELNNLPKAMPTTAITEYIRYRQRKLLILNPNQIIEAYQIFKPGSLNNLQKSLASGF